MTSSSANETRARILSDRSRPPQPRGQLAAPLEERGGSSARSSPGPSRPSRRRATAAFFIGSSSAGRPAARRPSRAPSAARARRAGPPAFSSRISSRTPGDRVAARAPRLARSFPSRPSARAAGSAVCRARAVRRRQDQRDRRLQGRETRPRPARASRRPASACGRRPGPDSARSSAKACRSSQISIAPFRSIRAPVSGPDPQVSSSRMSLAGEGSGPSRSSRPSAKGAWARSTRPATRG